MQGDHGRKTHNVLVDELHMSLFPHFAVSVRTFLDQERLLAFDYFGRIFHVEQVKLAVDFARRICPHLVRVRVGLYGNVLCCVNTRTRIRENDRRNYLMRV